MQCISGEVNPFGIMSGHIFVRHPRFSYITSTQKMWKKCKVVSVYLFLMHCRFKTLQKHTDIPSPLLKKIYQILTRPVLSPQWDRVMKNNVNAFPSKTSAFPQETLCSFFVGKCKVSLGTQNIFASKRKVSWRNAKYLFPPIFSPSPCPFKGSIDLQQTLHYICIIFLILHRHFSNCNYISFLAVEFFSY